MGSVTIHRRSKAWRDRWRSYVVEIDGRDVGKIARGEDKTFPLEPGDGHAVRLKIDWCSSPLVIVSGDEDSRLECGAAGNPLTGVFEVIFAQSSYIDLKRM